MKATTIPIAGRTLVALTCLLSGCAENSRPCKEGSVDPVVTYAAPPEYPALARDARIEGTVLVRVHVNAEGQVTAAEYIDGPEVLRDAALAASFDYQFSPARAACTPVEVDVNIPVTFRLQQ